MVNSAVISFNDSPRARKKSRTTVTTQSSFGVFFSREKKKNVNLFWPVGEYKHEQQRLENGTWYMHAKVEHRTRNNTGGENIALLWSMR